MSKFIHHYVSSTCFGPHRSIIRSVLYKLYSQTLVCAVIRVLLDTSSRYKVVGRTMSSLCQIKMDLKEINWEVVDWIDLAQVRDR